MKIVPLGQFGSNIFFAQPFLSLVVFNSITDAAFITWFLKRWFCKSRQFLDITQSKYVIIWWQCLKFVQIFILGCAGQIEVQKCPSLTKFLPYGNISTLWCFRPYKPYIFWKLLVQGYLNWYSQVSHTKIHKYKYTNTQIQRITKCRKDPTNGIFLKRGLFKGIKYDIPMC